MPFITLRLENSTLDRRKILMRDYVYTMRRNLRDIPQDMMVYGVLFTLNLVLIGKMPLLESGN